MRYICILPQSLKIEKFMKYIDKTKYKNITTYEELKKIDYLDFVYIRENISPNMKKELYNKKIKHSLSFILLNKIQIKSFLHTFVKSKSKTLFNKYFLDQYNISIDNYSCLDKLNKKYGKNTLYIVKPIKSNSGVGNKVFRGTNEIINYIKLNEKTNFYKSRENGINQWVIQKYMENPFLLNGKKFHIRWNILLANNNIYMYESGTIYPAKIKYDNQNLDMAIHDSHYKASPNEHKCFPHDFFNESYTKKIYLDIYKFFKYMKNIDLFKMECYKEIEKCFCILGVDFMITDDYQVKCIEINDLPGFKDIDLCNKYFIKGLLNLTLYETSITRINTNDGFLLIK